MRNLTINIAVTSADQARSAGSDWYGRRQESVEIGDAFNEAENGLAIVVEVRESAGIQKVVSDEGSPGLICTMSSMKRFASFEGRGVLPDKRSLWS